MLWTAAERGMAMGKWLKILCLAAIATAASGYYFYQRQAFARNFDVQTVALVNGDVRRVVSTSGTVNPVVRSKSARNFQARSASSMRISARP
jgi:multidrug efflux pump subunit AcrA (membrane-fusion protein)